MARQKTTYLIILLIGLAGGIVLGFLMTQQKIKSANKTIDELKTQQAQIESDFKAASVKMSRMEAELAKSRNNVMQKNTELLRAQTELARTKKVLEQALGKGQVPAEQAEESATTDTRASIAVVLPAGIRIYIIKDGDSLWKIAANELGNGVRYEEILKLNPGMTKDDTLAVGTKIKIPAK